MCEEARAIDKDVDSRVNPQRHLLERSGQTIVSHRKSSRSRLTFSREGCNRNLLACGIAWLMKVLV